MRVAAIDPGSPSENRLAVNDVIVQILPSKKRIGSTTDLQDVLTGVSAGDIVSFLVYSPVRGGGGTTRVVNIRAQAGR